MSATSLSRYQDGIQTLSDAPSSMPLRLPTLMFSSFETDMFLEAAVRRGFGDPVEGAEAADMASVSGQYRGKRCSQLRVGLFLIEPLSDQKFDKWQICLNCNKKD